MEHNYHKPANKMIVGLGKFEPNKQIMRKFFSKPCPPLWFLTISKFIIWAGNHKFEFGSLINF